MNNFENVTQHVTSVVVTVLCNQPEAFASDLSDSRSRYLSVPVHLIARKDSSPK